MRQLRRIVWLIGVPLRASLVLGIRGYRATLSGWLGGQCRFHPSCSRYAEEAISSRGVLVGAALSVWRILRCNPFGKGGTDPPPRARYDHIIPSLEGTEAARR
jgi:putative membrane protein insertion efficiency factor